MYNDPIDTMEIGNHRISIYYDSDALCPVKDWDLGGSYLWEHLEHGRYWLSTECDYKEWVSNTREYSLADLVQRMAAKVVSQDDIIKRYKAGKYKDLRFVYNRHERQWELQHLCTYGLYKDQWVNDIEIAPSDLKRHDYRMELLEPLDEEDIISLIQECARDFVIKYWESSGYCQGDHMRGVAFMSKERFDKRCGFNSKDFKDWKEQALSAIDGEIDCINKWAWGDVRGFILEEKVPFTKTYADGRSEEDFEWEEVDSCWGYYMDTDELFKEVISEHGLKESA